MFETSTKGGPAPDSSHDTKRECAIVVEAGDSDGSDEEIARLRALLAAERDKALDLRDETRRLKRKVVGLQRAAEVERADWARQRALDATALDAVVTASLAVNDAVARAKRRRSEPPAPANPSCVA